MKSTRSSWLIRLAAIAAIAWIFTAPVSLQSARAANLAVAITVATSSTPGASADVSGLDAELRKFVYTGTAGDVVLVQGSNDNATWATIFPLTSAAAEYSVNDRSLYYRTTRSSGTTAGVLYVSGQVADVGQQISGSVSTTGATATEIYGETFTANGGNSYDVMISGLKDDETLFVATLLGGCVRAGGTLSALTPTIVEITGSLNPGTLTMTAAADRCSINVVGVTTTNINWKLAGQRQAIAAF